MRRQNINLNSQHVNFMSSIVFVSNQIRQSKPFEVVKFDFIKTHATCNNKA